MPTENFSELHHARTIRDESALFSAAGDGQISFVSAEDIAAVAYRALTDERPHNRDWMIVGPELVSHDEVAAMFTEVLGREVRHVRISPERVAEGFMRFGLPEAYARRLGDGEERASRGEFAVLNGVVEEVAGRAPVRLRGFVEKNREVW